MLFGGTNLINKHEPIVRTAFLGLEDFSNIRNSTKCLRSVDCENRNTPHFLVRNKSKVFRFDRNKNHLRINSSHKSVPDISFHRIYSIIYPARCYCLFQCCPGIRLMEVGRSYVSSSAKHNPSRLNVEHDQKN